MRKQNHLIKCKAKFYSNTNHLNQLLCGFIRLKEMGIIEFEYEFLNKQSAAILEVIINEKIKVIYDTMDQKEFYAADIMQIKDIDYYFKRSFEPDIAERYSFNSYPLGLNYLVFHPRTRLIASKKEHLKMNVERFFRITNKKFVEEEFEFLPITHRNPKILFLTGLWDPEDPIIENESVREERIKINRFRIECIKACRERFGDSFIGGIEDSNFARQYGPEYIVDKSLTNRARFIDLIKEVDICIATTGLHSSIGWKFGEYVAASRAIISEPLHFDLPGDFIENKNYLVFENVQKLLHQVEILIENKELRQEIMWNNYNYYGNYLKPYKLVGNTISLILNQHYEFYERGF